MEQGVRYGLKSYAEIRFLGWQIYRLHFNNNAIIDIAVHFDKYTGSDNDEANPLYQIHVGIINFEQDIYQCNLLGIIHKSKRNIRPVFDLLKRHEEIAKIGQINMLVNYIGE